MQIPKKNVAKIVQHFKRMPWFLFVVYGSIALSISSTVYYFMKDAIIAYGDAESHLNIAKRVIHDLTPGVAQLGGIWLPLPHLLMIPFVFFDSLWKSGLAGSIVSGVSFVISSIYLYKITYLLTKSSLTSFLAFLVFALNPNILYLQSTPMTELLLIMFILLSSYYFIIFILRKTVNPLILAAVFGFCASISRYDGWFLVLFEAIVILLMYYPWRKNWKNIEGKLILFNTLAFFGIALWMLWDLLILGDPLYFTNSQFSAKTQQQNWLAKGQLPAYHNPLLAFLYYFVTSMSNSGVLIFAAALVGIYLFLRNSKEKNRYLIVLILMVPFIFYFVTLFVGQSVIFIPHLTPVGFEWRLFNVRYGLIMVPIVAFFFAYVFYRSSLGAKVLLLFLFVFQFMLYGIGYSKVITLADGTEGLSQAKRTNAERWMAINYDDGLVLIDDYARTMSIIRSNIPMENTIYIGNKPYWEESLSEPEKYAKWIIVQKDDEVWKNIIEKPEIQSRLYAYFQKAYTSPEILIFKKMPETAKK